MTFDCDLCGSSDAVEVPHARLYTNDQPIHICRDCGFVYVRNRRPSHEVADTWSEAIFGPTYTARTPHVRARQIFVAETLDVHTGLSGKSLCDIGAGEGQFLEIVRGDPYNARVFGIEPTKKNCVSMRSSNIDCLHGTAEDAAGDKNLQQRFDVATAMWTIENCSSCNDFMSSVARVLKPNGLLCIATGSRILVPFKKPLQYYLSTIPADTHAFRWSSNSLQSLLMKHGFEVEHVNRYIDNDILCVIGKYTGKLAGLRPKDNWQDIAGFFERWHAETQAFYPNNG